MRRTPSHLFELPPYWRSPFNSHNYPYNLLTPAIGVNIVLIASTYDEDTCPHLWQLMPINYILVSYAFVVCHAAHIVHP